MRQRSERSLQRLGYVGIVRDVSIVSAVAVAAWVSRSLILILLFQAGGLAEPFVDGAWRMAVLSLLQRFTCLFFAVFEGDQEHSDADIRAPRRVASHDDDLSVIVVCGRDLTSIFSTLSDT